MNKTIQELKDIHKGEDIWVIGAGSSMNFVDSSFFENKICIRPKNINPSNNLDFWPESWISI